MIKIGDRVQAFENLEGTVVYILGSCYEVLFDGTDEPYICTFSQIKKLY